MYVRKTFGISTFSYVLSLLFSWALPETLHPLDIYLYPARIFHTCSISRCNHTDNFGIYLPLLFPMHAQRYKQYVLASWYSVPSVPYCAEYLWMYSVPYVLKVRGRCTARFGMNSFRFLAASDSCFYGELQQYSP